MSSIVILLPMLFGLLGGTLLPEEIAVHWGMSGEADGFMNSSTVFFLLPAILLAIHWLCMILTAVVDPNAEQNKKMFGMIFWIIPVISLASCGTIFAAALGYTTKISAFIFLLLGVVFILIGNYMPKTTRSLTMGIKVRWAMANDDNWNATHRFAGKVYVALGLLCLLAIPLPPAAFPFVALTLVLVGALLPTLYSYRFYKKQIREGKATREDYKAACGEIVKKNKTAVTVSVVITILVIIVLVPLMFTGKIEATAGEESLSVKASFSSDVTIDYDKIDAVEYRENGVDGERVVGFGSAKLLLGTFQNEEFGNYTRYTYTEERPCIVLTVDEKIIVIGTDNEQTTMELYDRLLEEIAE